MKKPRSQILKCLSMLSLAYLSSTIVPDAVAGIGGGNSLEGMGGGNAAGKVQNPLTNPSTSLASESSDLFGYKHGSSSMMITTSYELFVCTTHGEKRTRYQVSQQGEKVILKLFQVQGEILWDYFSSEIYPSDPSQSLNENTVSSYNDTFILRDGRGATRQISLSVEQKIDVENAQEPDYISHRSPRFTAGWVQALSVFDEKTAQRSAPEAVTCTKH